MEVPIYDIDYNQHTGYYNIVDGEGNRYGEYLTYEDADDAIDRDTPEVEYVRNPEEYVVCREYQSYGTPYIMFTRGGISDHVSYPVDTAFSRRFNDESIKIYNSMKVARDVANKFNEISRNKRYWRYANWEAKLKWW